MNVRQAVIASLEPIIQLFVIEAQLTRHGSMQVVGMHLIFDRSEPQFVGLPVPIARLGSASAKSKMEDHLHLQRYVGHRFHAEPHSKPRLGVRSHRCRKPPTTAFRSS